MHLLDFCVRIFTQKILNFPVPNRIWQGQHRNTSKFVEKAMKYLLINKSLLEKLRFINCSFYLTSSMFKKNLICIVFAFRRPDELGGQTTINSR